MILALFERAHAVLRILLMLAFAALLGSVVVQVVSRLLLPNPPIWTEEFARFMLLFGAGLGAGWALRTGDLVNVDIVTSFLPQRVRLALEAAVMVAILAFCAALVPPSLDYVDIGSMQTSPALGWNMFWVHISVLLAPLTLGLACVERLIRNLVMLRKSA